MKKIITLIILFLLSMGVVNAEFNLPTVWIYNQVNGSSIDQNSNGIPDLADGVVGGGGGNITGAYGPYLFVDGTQINLDESVLNATIDSKVIAGGGDNASWNEALADTLYAPIGTTGGNSSFNQTLTDSLYLSLSGGDLSGAITSTDWSNVTITESQISDLSHTVDTNETTRMNNIADFSCGGTDKVSSFNSDGTPVCTSDQEGSGAGTYDWNYTVDGSGTNSITDGEKFDFVAGNNISITDDGNGITINAVDTKITQAELLAWGYYTIVETANNIGNWSDDKGDYYTSTTVDTNINNNVSVLVANDTAQADLINSNYANSLHLSQDNWFNDTLGYIYWESGNRIRFNESKLETVYYNATDIGIVRGTSTSDITAIQAYNGNSYNVTEEAGANGMDFRINFTGVADFNQFIYRYRNDPGETHDMIVSLWDYNDNDWENYDLVSVVGTYNVFDIPVLDNSEHIENGIVQMRFYVADNGNTGHTHYFDYVTIVDGFATPSGSEVDPLSIHKNGEVPLTDDWPVGGFSITGINDLNATNVYIGTDIVYGSSTVDTIISNQNNYSESDIINYVNANGNWSNDKGDYYTSTTVNTIISNQNNYTESDIINYVNANGNWSDDKSSYTTTGNDPNYVAVTGDSMTGELNMTENDISSVNCINGFNGGRICFI